MSITLEELRLQSRQRADMENNPFIGDGELDSYINNSIAELRDLLAEAYGSDYFVEETDAAAITSGTATYALPADFYELRAVDIRLNSGSDWIDVARFNFNERNKVAGFGGWANIGTNIRYRIVGNNIQFSPIPDQAAEYRIWYVPVYTKLVAVDDELDELNGYSEYIIVDSAIKMLQKEESDVTVLLAQKQVLAQRIRDKAAQRDAANADTIQDIYAQDDEPYYRRGV